MRSHFSAKLDVNIIKSHIFSAGGGVVGTAAAGRVVA